MLAICSDLDETPDAAAYFALSHYLNTREHTAVGRGVGLEVGNTMFFDMAPGEFSYWNASVGDREKIHALIQSGHIDSFHSFGDQAKDRAAIERSLGTLERNQCRLRVWVDHAVASTNLGADIMQGKGDLRGDPAYHTDLSIKHGVRYVWLGRVSSCIGQDVPYSLRTSLAQRADARSIITTARDAVKYLSGTMGNPKYALHRGNRLTRPYTLRDGHQVIEFMRCNPNPYGVSVGDNAPGIPAVINNITLDLLHEREGWCILYTHLGKGLKGPGLLSNATREAFEKLAERYGRGEILVATTRRLLDYHTMWHKVGISLHRRHVDIESRGEDVTGLTLYGLPEGFSCQLDGAPVALKENRADETGRVSHSISWTRLDWPF
jgi:hypothetical protein